MKRFEILVISVLLIAVFVVSVGCEESSQLDPKRVRLVVNENMKLKEVVKARDAKIVKLNKVIANLEKQSEKEQSTQDNLAHATIKIMRDLSAATERVNALTEENEQLKAAIKELQ